MPAKIKAAPQMAEAVLHDTADGRHGRNFIVDAVENGVQLLRKLLIRLGFGQIANVQHRFRHAAQIP